MALYWLFLVNINVAEAQANKGVEMIRRSFWNVSFLLIGVAISACNAVDQNPASLDRIRFQQTQALFTSCMRKQYAIDAQIVYRIGDLAHTCKLWAREQMKGPYES